MDRQLKQTALPCRLRGEHIGGQSALDVCEPRARFHGECVEGYVRGCPSWAPVRQDSSLKVDNGNIRLGALLPEEWSDGLKETQTARDGVLPPNLHGPSGAVLTHNRTAVSNATTKNGHKPLHGWGVSAGERYLEPRSPAIPASAHCDTPFTVEQSGDVGDICDRNVIVLHDRIITRTELLFNTKEYSSIEEQRQLHGCDELHAIKYRASPDVLSSAASVARPAIPPPAEAGGFSRRNL